MKAYWDTSALLKLIYTEPHSDRAVLAQQASQQVFTWDWTRVESNAGVARRGGAHARKALLTLLSGVQWIKFDSQQYDSLIELCIRHKLRSADAGHLYCLMKLSEVLGEVTFVCFDSELVKAARKEGIKIF